MRIGFLLIFIFVPLSPVFANSDPNCDSYISHEGWREGDGEGSKVGAYCKKFESSSGPIASRYPDGSVIPNPYFQTKMARNSSSVSAKELAELKKAMLPSAAKKKSVQETVKRLQQVYSDRIESMPASPYRKLLLERLQQMKVTYVKDSAECRESLVPTAFTEPAKSLIELCESGLGYPIEALVPVLAHEIAHLMDPCTQEVFPFVATKVKALKKSGALALKGCPLASEEDSGFGESDIKALVAEFESGARGILPTNDNQAIVSSLVKCGVLKAPHQIIEGNLEAHPFRSLHQCSSKYASDAKPSGNSATSSAGGIADEKPISFSASKACTVKAKECFGDHLGAEMTDAYLLRYPHSMRPEASKEMLAVFTAGACDFGDFEGRSYPSPNKRIAAFLQYPRVQAALKCSGLSYKSVCPLSVTSQPSRTTGAPGVQ